MSDTYRPGQGVAYHNNLSKLRSRGNSLSYGLVIGVDGDNLLLVRVQSTFLAARIYDEVLSMDDPCRDNVRLDISPFGGGTAMGDKLRAKAERDRKAKSGGAAVREEHSVEAIKRDVDGMAASAVAHRGKGCGGPDGPR